MYMYMYIYIYVYTRVCIPLSIYVYIHIQYDTYLSGIPYYNTSFLFGVLHSDNTQRDIRVGSDLWQCAAPLADHVIGTMTQFSAQSHDPDTELTNLNKANARLGSDKYYFGKSLLWLIQGFQINNLSHRKPVILPNRPPCPV